MGFLNTVFVFLNHQIVAQNRPLNRCLRNDNSVSKSTRLCHRGQPQNNLLFQVRTERIVALTYTITE
jgi:hypothetical protein